MCGASRYIKYVSRPMNYLTLDWCLGKLGRRGSVLAAPQEQSLPAAVDNGLL